MVDLGVYNFIKKGLAAGKTKEQITADLTRGGLITPTAIEEAYAAVAGGAAPQAAAPVSAPGSVSVQQFSTPVAIVTPQMPAAPTPGMQAPMSAANTSGQGKASIVPPEVRKWNWGAFGFTWLWGIFNGTFIALLVFIPIVGFVMIFVLGAKGSEWAWRNKKWESVERFRKVQHRWAIACLIFYIIIPVMGIGVTIALVSLQQARLKGQAAMQNVQANQQQVQQAIDQSGGMSTQ